MTHCIRLQVWLTNQSYFFQTITVDGEVTALEYIQGNLTGISFVDFAIWNQNISTQDIQGRYTGELLFSRYLENVTSPHIQTWFTVDVQDEEEIILSNPGFFTGMLFLSFFLILLIIVAIASPIIFKLLIKKKISDEITGEMVDQMSFIKEDMDVAELKSYPHISANLRVLYKLLQKAFKQLKVILDELDSEEQSTSVREKRLLSPWTHGKRIRLVESDYDGLNSTSLDILIYLLENIVQGTFFSVLKAELKLKSSILTNNLNYLEKMNLITRKRTSNNPDLYYIVISITPKGTRVLYQIYCKLGKLFEKGSKSV